MTTRSLDAVTADWARLGVLFNIGPASSPPDVEQLLLDTARWAPQSSRLLTAAATWLVQYGDLVDAARLARLVRDGLEPAARPILGLLLDAVAHHDPAHAARFADVLTACGQAVGVPRPLLDLDRASERLVELARQEASDPSRRWGRWFPPIELKLETIRPRDWVLDQNPALPAHAGTR